MNYATEYVCDSCDRREVRDGFVGRDWTSVRSENDPDFKEVLCRECFKAFSKPDRDKSLGKLLFETQWKDNGRWKDACQSTWQRIAEEFVAKYEKRKASGGS